MIKDSYLRFSPEVQAALDRNLPLVALESSLIAHGLPYPENIETARRLEGIVGEHGAVPAAIAVIGGRVKVGLSGEDLRKLARGEGIRKISRCDLPIVVAKGLDGATTVAATMYIASSVGIRVLATGGIGGVHRGAGQSLDISADLPELARTRVAVVCAGPKAIVDLALTREWLETHGVPILGYGTEELPAFYSRSSGLPVDCRVDGPEEAARIIHAKWGLGLEGGILIAVPVPAEAEVPRDVVEKAIAEALTAAERRGIRGEALTPFLLAQLNEITDGASLRANIALLQNNAAVAAEIAKALHRLMN